jgi:hypothetical protein
LLAVDDTPVSHELTPPLENDEANTIDVIVRDSRGGVESRRTFAGNSEDVTGVEVASIEHR